MKRQPQVGSAGWIRWIRFELQVGTRFESPGSTGSKSRRRAKVRGMYEAEVAPSGTLEIKSEKNKTQLNVTTPLKRPDRARPSG
jgi:hypothetical protein